MMTISKLASMTAATSGGRMQQATQILASS